MCARAFPLAFGAWHVDCFASMLHTLVTAVATIILAIAHIAVIDTLFVIALEVPILAISDPAGVGLVT